MTKTLIYVHKTEAQQGGVAPIIIRRNGENEQKAAHVEIKGPSSVVYDINAASGPKVWIETEAEVIAK